MACYHPLTAFRQPDRGQKTCPLVFSPSPGYESIQVPCGQCIGCRLDRSRHWAIRCVHESQMYIDNCFITLTYDDDHLPKNKSLNKRELQLFIKKLRAKIRSKNKNAINNDEKIKFFACGEYGELNDRPHYHACIFNYQFTDRKPYTVRDGVVLYQSEELKKLWKFGFSTVGDVTFESAAYVARYCLKKITGPRATDHYRGRIPEFTQMSRRPGIGRSWCDKYIKTDVMSTGQVILRGGLTSSPPRYYNNIIEGIDSVIAKQLKMERRLKINESDMSSRRLLVKEELKNLQLKLLKRGLECQQ